MASCITESGKIMLAMAGESTRTKLLDILMRDNGDKIARMGSEDRPL